MILSIDFGGTRTRVGWFSHDLTLLARDEAPSDTHQSPDQIIARMVALARRVVPQGVRPAAIGICAPGPQAYTGLVSGAATLPGWDGIPLLARIRGAFDGAPTCMENDANLAVLAEYHFGAARGCNPALYLTISTGIGGGAVINGELFSGWRGLALEPGHIQFPAPDGVVYSLELLASGTGIARLAREKLISTDAPSVLRGKTVDGKSVGEAARHGDALALAVIREAGRWLGLGLVALVHLFNPQAVVLGGSVMNLGDLILTPVRQTLAEFLIDPAFDDPQLIRIAQLGDDVCLMGAAYHARKTFMSEPG